VGAAPGGGTVTTSGMISPAPLYSVAKPVLLSETQNGEPELNDTPHGLAKFGSVVFAIPGISDTRFVCVKLLVPSACARFALAHKKSIAATTSLRYCIPVLLVLIGFPSTTLFRAPRVYSPANRSYNIPVVNFLSQDRILWSP
jgi:hypothetical protein